MEVLVRLGGKGGSFDQSINIKGKDDTGTSTDRAGSKRGSLVCGTERVCVVYWYSIQ